MLTLITCAASIKERLDLVGEELDGLKRLR
jgi:hypothetical protein